MLTDEQKTQFMMALAAHNSDADLKEEVNIDDSHCPDIEQVVDCSDTIDAFFVEQGTYRKRDGTRSRKLHQNDTCYGTIYEWRDVQARKGLRRGNLYVMDFGDRRAAYFDGETVKG